MAASGVLLSPAYLGGIAVLAVILLLAKLSTIGRRPRDLPPGPPTLPLIGNLHQMPTKEAHLQFQKWAKEYGPVYSLILGTKPMIVLSSDVDVKDMLDRRSGIYSDRPDMFIAQKIASGNLRLVVMRYGDNWRMIHKIVHNILNIKAAVTYVPYQDLENKIFLESLLDSPDDLLHHIRRFTYSLSTQMIFGYRCVNNRDPNLLQLFTCFEHWGKLSNSSSAQTADLFPILQRLPSWIAPNVSYAKKLHAVEKELYVSHWMRSKMALENGTGLPCFCNDFYRAQTVEKFSDDAAGYMSGSLLEAGSDTTASTLYGFILALLVWPEVQAKLHEEIDRVVGPDRMPTIDDCESLPYVRCCIKESLRWMPTVILGVPHAVIREDYYKGWRIPKGSTVINNVWAIHMDPDRCPNPRVFNPDRFKDDHTTLYQSAVGDTTKRDNFVFGTGRRLCQGIHIAERSLFLGISRLAWSFTLSPAKDSLGQPWKYDTETFVGGISVQPQDYPCIITPRSAEKAEIIRKAASECRTLLDDKTGQWKKIPDGMAFSTWVPDHVEPKTEYD
ncbi:cytochrome p450 monooxygenase [Grosmannia clavigera kw1407]|uniref:Cytochrome p450 monooxygenase n=1 Tax=Grosmannia clavigera (strain kw1407 / UAMH 11150) TaxID=655863 RepID=F0XAS9_GROCL|nr:cytochrome p450 monooxygenase [Grosmannia clavigera kw1407]EFX05422.1 cytochrome p450 monooxygenase [Grosmannia clavigera kw1407]